VLFSGSYRARTSIQSGEIARVSTPHRSTHAFTMRVGFVPSQHRSDVLGETAACAEAFVERLCDSAHYEPPPECGR
jgi:hypothetical protein